MPTKLFSNSTWSLPIPEPFDIMAKVSTSEVSIYNTNSTSKSTFHAPTLRAILAYAKVQSFSKIDPDNYVGAIGFQDKNMIIAEYVSKNINCVVFNKITGKFMASNHSSVTKELIEPYSLSDSGNSGSALLFALMPILIEDEEFSESYNNFCEQWKLGFRDEEVIAKAGHIMCDNAYRRIENAQSLKDAGIMISISSTGNIPPLTDVSIKSGVYSPDKVMYGKYEIMKASRVGREKINIKIEDFQGKYQMSERSFSESEKQLIPKLSDWYMVSKDVVNICKHIKGTVNSQNPMRNIMMRGPAGTGKTEAAKAIAAGLNIPYMFLTCSANTEIYDLFGQILPELNGIESDDGKLPNIDDIMMDPATVYQELTGIYKEDATAQETCELLIKKKAESVNNDIERGFKYVETSLVKAIRYGYLVEIQEPSIIANPGVLVGLNGLLDRCESVTLATGEIIKRHPECVIVVTTNTDYEGCKNLNQSFTSRMNLILDMGEPDEDTIAERVMKVTGFTDKSLLMNMIMTMRDISEKCKETMITDGSHGMRELISWVQSTMILNDPFEAAMCTIIPSASADAESRAELISTCLEPKFASM